MKRILFVCTGNTCRSPMGEAMLRKIANEQGLAVDVRSAGVSTIDGLPTSENTLEVLRQKDIEHRGESRSLSMEDVRWADLILTMTGGHKRALIQQHPEAVDKTFALKEYVLLDEQLMAVLDEASRLYSELQMKRVLGEEWTAEEQERLEQLERNIPPFDISDPFGGSLEVYKRCAAEIEGAVVALVERLKTDKA